MLSAPRAAVTRVSGEFDFSLRYRPAFLVAVLGFLFGVAVPSLRAQSYLQNAGVPSFTTKLPVENGFVNVANGNLHLEIPLGSYPERGGAVDKVVLMYDSDIWYPYGQWSPQNIDSANPPWGRDGGWRLVTSGDVGQITNGELDYSWCSPVDDYRLAKYYPWIWTAPDGTQHSFPVSLIEPLYPVQCPSTSTASSSAYASDGSGFYMNVTYDATNYTLTPTVYAPDGTVMGSAKTDSNGNTYTESFTSPPYDLKLLDTVPGRIPVEITESSDGNTIYYKVPNTSGGQSTYTVVLGTVYVSTSFGQKNVAEYSGHFQAPAEIDLPDGTSYQFSYDSGTAAGHYGLLTSMTLPTTGLITYTFSNFTDAAGNVSRWITSRTNPDGMWTYTGPNVTSSCGSGQIDCQQWIKVTKPSQNYAVYTFTLNGGSWPTGVSYYGSGVGLLASTSVCYNFVTLSSSGTCSYSVTAGAPSTNVYRTAQTDTVGSASKTTEYSWDPSDIGNLTQLSEWKFGNAPPNPADRTTTIGYFSSGYIINRPATITVKNASGNQAQTTNGYDTHGNLTSVTRWLNTGPSNPTTTYAYNSYGMPTSMTDPNGNQTTYTYDSTGATLSQIQYPTPSSGVTQNEKFSFDPGTGLLMKYTDRNGHSTTYTYDAMWRPTGITYPDGGQTTFTYYFHQGLLTEYFTKKLDTSGDLTNGDIQWDELGREDRVAILSGEVQPYNETVNICFNADGLPSFKAYPFQDGGWNNPISCTLAGDTFSYDGLGRVTLVTHSDGSFLTVAPSNNCSTVTDEQSKTRESCTDGFGNATQVVENPGGLGYTTNYSYDALGDLTSVTQNSSRPRTFTYDSLSRLTQSLNPEIVSPLGDRRAR